MTLQCAWCSRVKVRNRWIPVPTIGTVSHGICPKCSEKMLEEARGIIGTIRGTSWAETRMLGNKAYVEHNPLPQLR